MIDIHILAEELGGTAVTAGEGVRGRLDLRSARPLPSDDVPLDPGCIYVVDDGVPDPSAAVGSLSGEVPADAVRIGRYDGCCLAFPGTCDAGAVPPGADCLLLPGFPDGSSALSAILDVFEEYGLLEKRMFSAAAGGQSAGAVLQLCAGHLANPIALFDSMWLYIAEAGEFSEGRSDAIWDDVHEKGYTTIEHGSHEETQRLQEGLEPVAMDAGGTPTLSASIHSGGRLEGYLAMTDVNEPFSEGQASTLEWIARVFEETWRFYELDPDRSGISNGIALQTIFRMPVGEEMVESYLARRGWRIDDAYRLLYLFRADGSYNGTEISFLHRKMEAMFPLDVVISIDGGVLVVVRQHAGMEGADLMEQKRAELRDLVGDGDLRCAASEPVDGFMDLGDAFVQCQAVRSALQRGQTGPLAAMGDVAGEYLLDALDATVDLDAICSPAVQSLWGCGNGPVLVESLRVYIMHGRNLSHAAQELCVHRNTLMYRVEQIEKHLGLDLAELGEDRLFYLYISCLIVEGGAGEGGS